MVTKVLCTDLFDKPQWVGSFTASTYDAGLESELDKGSFLLPSREAVLYHIYQVVELQKSEQTLLSVQSDRVPRYIQILQEVRFLLL